MTQKNLRHNLLFYVNALQQVENIQRRSSDNFGLYSYIWFRNNLILIYNNESGMQTGAIDTKGMVPEKICWHYDGVAGQNIQVALAILSDQITRYYNHQGVFIGTMSIKKNTPVVAAAKK